MLLWSIHSCFHWCKIYKNRPRNARVIVENKWFLFMEHRVVGKRVPNINDKFGVLVNQLYSLYSLGYAVCSST